MIGQVMPGEGKSQRLTKLAYLEVDKFQLHLWGGSTETESCVYVCVYLFVFVVRRFMLIDVYLQFMQFQVSLTGDKHFETWRLTDKKKTRRELFRTRYRLRQYFTQQNHC